MNPRFKQWTLITFFIVILFSSLHLTAFAEGEQAAAPTTDSAAQSIKKGVFGEKLDQEEDTNYFEKTLAGIFVSFSTFMIDILGLKDFNQLIFVDDTNTDLVYGTFEKPLFDIMGSFYNGFVSVAGVFLVIALTIWGFILFYRALDPLGHSSARELMKGIFVYLIFLYYGFYFFEVIFEFNTLIITWAADGLQRASGWDVHSLNVLDIFARETTSLPKALLLVIVVFSLGVLNYQYAVRKVMLMFLISFFPLAVYMSIFPATRKSLDNWFREFATQVFTQAGHAIAYGLLLAILSKAPNFWLLIAMIIGMPTIAALIRIPLGAAGGANGGGGLGGSIKGMLGSGSLMAAQSLLGGPKGLGAIASGANQVVKGASTQAGASALGAGKMGMSAATGAAASSPGFMSSLSSGASGFASSALKHSVGAAVAAPAFMAMSAATGDVGAGLAAGRMAYNNVGGLGRAAKSATRGIVSGATGTWDAYKKMRKKQPVQSVPGKNTGGARAGQLALPAGSQRMLALPSGEKRLALPASTQTPNGASPLSLPGIQATPLSNQGGVMLTNVPSHSSLSSNVMSSSPVGQSDVQLGGATSIGAGSTASAGQYSSASASSVEPKPLSGSMSGQAAPSVSGSSSAESAHFKMSTGAPITMTHQSPSKQGTSSAIKMTQAAPRMNTSYKRQHSNTSTNRGFNSGVQNRPAKSPSAGQRSKTPPKIIDVKPINIHQETLPTMPVGTSNTIKANHSIPSNVVPSPTSDQNRKDASLQINSTRDSIKETK